MDNARRSARRLVALLALGSAPLLALLTTTGVADARVESAQTATTSVPSSSTTARMSANANAVTTEGSPTNSAGLYVFAGVCIVIVGGTAILFVRHRRSGSR